MATLEEIKARQQVVWSSGDYGKIAWITVPLADELCEAIELRAGSTVLDVATGTGHVALAAARRFCTAIGVDFVPSLLDIARKRAAIEGLTVEFREADAENLPFPDDSFDAVLSVVGAMFTPDQERTAAELVRVCRPGGTIGMINWTPTGYVGELFKTIARHVPPPPEIKPAALWGTEDRVRDLFGDTVSALNFKRGSLTQNYLTPQHFGEFFITNYGPTLKAAESLDPPRRAGFVADLTALAERFNRAGGGALAIQADYVTVIATKR